MQSDKVVSEQARVIIISNNLAKLPIPIEIRFLESIQDFTSILMTKHLEYRDYIEQCF